MQDVANWERDADETMRGIKGRRASVSSFVSEDADFENNNEHAIDLRGRASERNELASIDAVLPARKSSRSLTRKELAQLTVEIRSLNRLLSASRVNLKASQIMIVTKIYDTQPIEATATLVRYMTSQLQNIVPPFRIWLQDKVWEHPSFDSKNLKRDLSDDIQIVLYSIDGFQAEIQKPIDMVITLGGDGTVLFTSWLFQEIVPPILTFNMGSLGFLNKYSFTQHETVISDILARGVRCSLRMRFQVTLMKALNISGKLPGNRNLDEELVSEEKTHSTHATYSVLNEVVLDRGPNPTMSSCDLYGDNQHLTAIEADGVVISTPTGSTAYSLSAGGSLVHPELPAMLVTPICPHTLSFRPFVVPDALVLKVGVPFNSRTTAWCSFDGRERVELCQGDYLVVSASPFPFPLIHNGIDQEDWFVSLSETLGWNDRRRRKPFVTSEADAKGSP
ncbi:hypothetical protein CANCADRAFT_31121 [Tortispora caseinolytica NRRL Y-17796]|uniref:NAD+ kinase n=1 Tax=Tortispora caseinolytica NRRL Y-17796 TaxID=767744 RepID=A0A1E4TE99_9ASCO|nr:hypothetical protein CANCADRAFT_31121 [Tortispora caseinolytica NRRL Y-17796]